MTTKRTTSMAAQDIRPGRILVEDDGRMREVRDVKYGYSTVVLVYTAGPCDVFRRTYMLDVLPLGVLPESDTCANCRFDLSDHDANEIADCQDEHLAHLGL